MGSGILGIGIDMVRVKRMRRLFERYQGRLVARLLHPLEMSGFEGSPDQAAFLARRFAAKEAMVKALGSGFSSGTFASNIAILHDERGRPHGSWPEKTRASLPGKGRRMHLSISGETGYAVAQAVLTEEE